MQRRLVTVNSTKDANSLFAQINLQHDIIYNKISPSERMHALSSARRAVVNDWWMPVVRFVQRCAKRWADAVTLS